MVKLVGVPGAAPTGFVHARGALAGVLAGMVGDRFSHCLVPGTIKLHVVKEGMVAKAEDEDFTENELATYAERKLRSTDVLSADSFLLAVGTLQQAEPPSAQGKWPHSIVFPSVARSSLTWSLCFMCPLCGCLCRGRQRR
jgi:hypothetical protein